MEIQWVPADVFISYSRDEKLRIERIARRLEALGLRLWFDAELKSGSTFGEEIDREVSHSRCVLVCWSKSSTKSVWVRAEAHKGLERGILIAASLEPLDDIPVPFNQIHAVSLADWNGEPDHAEWQNLLSELGRRIGRPSLPLLELTIHSQSLEDLKNFYWSYPTDAAASEIWSKIEAAERATYHGAREIVRKKALEQEATLRVRREDGIRQLDREFEDWLTRLRSGSAGAAPVPEFQDVTEALHQARQLQSQLIDTKEQLAIATRKLIAAEQEAEKNSFTQSLAMVRPESGKLELVGSPPETIRRPEAKAGGGRKFSLFAAVFGLAVGISLALAATHLLLIPNAVASAEEAVRVEIEQANHLPSVQAQGQAQEQVAPQSDELRKAMLQELMPAQSESVLIEVLTRWDSEGAVGINNLAGKYFRADSSPEEYEVALGLWRLAVAWDVPDAFANLGYAFYRGWGVTKDIDAANAYFVLGSKSGSARADWHLGELIEKGEGRPKDVALAIAHFEKAVEEGRDKELRALNNLAEIYIDGKDQPRDLSRAQCYLQLARRSSNEGALGITASLQSKLNRAAGKKSVAVMGDCEKKVFRVPTPR